MYSIVADAIIVVHFAFIIFVVVGGMLVFKWKWFIYIHVPAVIWAALIEFFRWGCPLTPLENYYRNLSGVDGYSGGFIDYYIVPVVYPSGLTPGLQFALGFFVLLINLVIYGFAVWKFRKNR